jgi:membrane protease YdiL (CAAX protease family)
MAQATHRNHRFTIGMDKPYRVVDALRAGGWFRWRPGPDLVAVAVSWLLVVGALYTATVVIGTELFGGMAYFALYAVLGATVFGVGLPVYWMTVVRRRPLHDLGLTTQRLGISLALQLVFAAFLYLGAFTGIELPAGEQLVPLVALALAIGFFEALFWRGWVQLRLEESFGIIPGVVLGSLVYAAYHIGYGMTTDEMLFLFWIGVMYATVFRLTKSVFILWPIFQPMGQLVTLVREGLSLPILAALGFIEVLAVMGALLWVASRYVRQRSHVLAKSV